MRSLVPILVAIGLCLALLSILDPGGREERGRLADPESREALPVPALATRPAAPAQATSVVDARVADAVDDAVTGAITSRIMGAVEGASRVRITEIGAANRSTILDEVGRTPDWIELHNPTSVPVDLARSTLAVASALDQKPWELPAIVLAPGGSLIVWASGDDRHGISSREIASASTMRFRETVIRLGDSWRFVVGNAARRNVPENWHALDFDDSRWQVGASGFGYADGDDATRVPEGTTTVFIRRSFDLRDPGRLGQLILRIDYDDGFVAYLNGTRIAGANSPVNDPLPGAVATEKREVGKAECHDLSAHVDLLRPGRNVLAIVGIDDSPSSDMSLLPELGSLAFVCHTDFRLPATGGEVTLRDAEGAVVDRVEYPKLDDDRSWGWSVDGATARAANGDGDATDGTWGFFVTPTPGRANRTRLYRQVPTGSIRFEPPPGPLVGTPHVRALLHDATPGVTIGLSADASSPRAPRGAAAESLPLDRDLLLRAATFVGGERLSPVIAASYFRQPEEHLPVLSVSMDPAEFRRIQLGINRHGRDYESSAYLEVFAPGGERVAATGVGFRLHGGYGRRGGFATKKSYRLYFRRFHGDSSLGYPLIPDVPVEALQRVVLRANFNDRLGAYHAGASFIRDQVLRDLHRGLGAPVAAGAWCILHVNMEYRGIYNAVERLDESFLTRHFGGEAWDMVKHGNEVVCGTRESWDALRDLVLGRTHGRPPTLEELEHEVDLENFTGYVILNLWSQNQDWPQNNWYAARRRTSTGAAPGDTGAPSEASPSRWVFLSWDAEWGMGLNPGGWRAESFDFIAQKQGRIRDLFAALWSHEAYRQRFRDAVTAALAGPLSPANVEATVLRHAAALRPVMEAELRALAPRFKVRRWEQNVQTVHNFARLRGPWFQRLVAAAAEGPLPERNADG